MSAGLVCAAIVVVGGGTLTAEAAPATPGTAGPARSVLTTTFATQRAAVQAALSAASAAAVSSGVPVVVDALTTPTQQTSALPDGQIQLDVSSLPVRVEQNGTWVPVDTTLVSDGEWLVPAASVAPVRFSVGGSDQLAQVQTETGEWVTETWPYGPLPVPSVDGDTATYAEVLPDVDLKMVATKTGQASIYVVKSEAAAQSAKLDDLHVLIDGADLTTKSTGVVNAEAADGSGIVAGQPLWWDSSDGATYREPGEEGSPAPVIHEVGADRIAMDVGASVSKEETRTGDEVTYPIFVDPDWSSGIAASWYTDAAYPNQSYLSAGVSDVLRVGNYGSYKSDMFFQFPIGALSGKIVGYAVLNTTQLSMNACGTPGAIQVHTYGPKPAGFTWNQEQSWNAAGTGGWSAPLQSWVGPGCGSAAMAVGWNVTAGVQGKVGASDIQFAFTPSVASAPTRRHYSRAASLVVTYNTRPNTPTNPVFISPSRQCGTAAAPAMIGQTDVTVQVSQTDPDPGTVDNNFFLMKASDLNTLVQHRTSGKVAQGPRSATFTGLSSGETYAWYARGSDWIHDGLAGTPWCYFTVDTTKPAVPSVTASSNAAYVVGQPVVMAVTGAADVAGYVSWITPTQLVSPVPAVPAEGTVSVATALPPCTAGVGSTVRWTCANGASPVALTVAPIDALSTLWVSAYDKAGNQSTATGFPLYPNGDTGTPAASANLDAGHAWHLSTMSTPLPEVIPDSNPWIGTNGIDLLIPETSSRISTDLPDPPLESPVLSTAGGTALEVSTMVAPVDATNSFTFSVWLKGGYNGLNGATQKIAMQGGGTSGSIQLQVAPNGVYSFCLGNYYVSSASTDRTSNCATGSTMNGSWQMVTGIWDAVNQQLRLHVGGSMTPVAVNGHVLGAGSQAAGGPLVFGPAPMTGRWEGLFTNPVLVPGVVDHAQLERLAAFEMPFSD